MVRAILGVGALLAAVIALAGCGGGGGGSASATTGAVAGAHHARGAGSFRASVRGFEARLQTSVHAFRSGNPILNDCMGVVDTKIGRRASTVAQKHALAHLHSACAAITQAADAGATGNLTKAKQLAGAALAQVRIAARLSG
jgi:ABC-type glycerol-3-phosphate transport system substrate-binding protein